MWDLLIKPWSAGVLAVEGEGPSPVMDGGEAIDGGWRLVLGFNRKKNGIIFDSDTMWNKPKTYPLGSPETIINEKMFTIYFFLVFYTNILMGTL